jgi:hypothetical protein
MPTNNRSGCNHDERRFPSSPESSQHDPEQLVQRREPMAGSFGVQSNQLLAEGQVFEDEILTIAESAQKPAEEMAERCDHAKNLTENRKIEFVAKSLILRLHHVLTNDSHCGSWHGRSPAILGSALHRACPGRGK